MNHPILFEKACLYEESHEDGRTFTWRDGGRLRELQDEMSHSKTNREKKPLLIDSLASLASMAPKIDIICDGGGDD